MKITSHFIGIEINPKLLSDIFVEVYKYLKEKNILDSVSLQNPLSPHITVYYLKKDILNKDQIKNDISEFDMSKDIYLTGINYFFKEEARHLLYFEVVTEMALKEYRDVLHEKYILQSIEDSDFDFSPHITLLKILNSEKFEEHREGIENIIHQEIKKMEGVDISLRKISLYAVNSLYKEEIQIRI